MNFQAPQLNLRARLRATGIHLMIGVTVAVVAATLVFALWYPWPFRLASGGQGLFVLIVSVDLVLGPLLTLAVFDIAKGWRHLRRDLAVIGALQVAALAFGLCTVYEARPVAIVFETDRFRVITAGDVYLPELTEAPIVYQRLPLTGPWLLGTRSTKPGEERNDALFMGLKGVDVGQRPRFWQPYELSRSAALARSRPVAVLTQHYPAQKAEIEALVGELRVLPGDARFLPLVARHDWVVLMSATGEVVGYAPLDGFF